MLTGGGLAVPLQVAGPGLSPVARHAGPDLDGGGAARLRAAGPTPSRNALHPGPDAGLRHTGRELRLPGVRVQHSLCHRRRPPGAMGYPPHARPADALLPGRRLQGSRSGSRPTRRRRSRLCRASASPSTRRCRSWSSRCAAQSADPASFTVELLKRLGHPGRRPERRPAARRSAAMTRWARRRHHGAGCGASRRGWCAASTSSSASARPE
jgi:hypothetical protein